jgi:hypothetical protein
VRLRRITLKARVEDLSLDDGLAATTTADVDERARFLILHPDKPPHRRCLGLALMHLAAAQETASNLCSPRDYDVHRRDPPPMRRRPTAWRSAICAI